MGAFYLYKKEKNINQNSIQDIYKKKGFDSPKIFDIGNYHLMLFQKYLLNVDNYFQENKLVIFAVGSFIYRGLSYNQSLKRLLSDYKKNVIDKENFYGNYVIIFFNKETNKIDFFIDPAFIKNVYFDKVDARLSTDFLVLLNARNGNHSINRMAIIENITTGNLISPDTYVNEIQKLDRSNLDNLRKHFTGINFKTFQPNILCNISNRKEAIEQANNLLKNYFRGVSAISTDFGSHIGLTGGFDSRLLLMHAHKQVKNLNTNSFWRPNSPEYENAKKLAEVSGLDFFSYEKKSFEAPERDKMIDDLMFVFDGQVRSQNRWDEEFALPDYTANIANNHFVGFHGCGGEQYRNADHIRRKISLRSFILNEWMFKQGSNAFIDNDLKWEIHKHIERKIRRLLNNLDSKIGLLELKKIQNEIWNTANRATRVNVLNQQQFYFAPFTEFIISQNAYKYAPFLGSSLSFQIDMMIGLDTELASVITNYGFNLVDGEPFKNHLKAYIADLLPRKLILHIFHKIKNRKLVQDNSNHFIQQAHPLLQDFQNSIDYSKLIQNVNLSPGIYAFDHLLKTVLY